MSFLRPTITSRWTAPSALVAEVLAVTALAVFAFAVRFPFFMLIPRFTDEVRFYQWAARINAGEPWPLVYEGTGYNGPLLLWLLAAARWIRPAVDTPRLLILLLGVSGVLFLYAAGRVLHGRMAGFFSAALLAASFVPILVFSHVAWFVSMAFWLLLLALWMVAIAGTAGKGWALVFAALAMGLSVQQYPLMAAFAPGMALWLAFEPEGRRIIRSRWAFAAVLVGLVAYSPVALHHAPRLLGGGPLDLSGGYNQVLRNVAEESYLDGMGLMAHSIVEGLAGASHGGSFPAGSDPLAWAISALVVAGLIVSLWVGHRLPAILALTSAVLIPIVIRDYDFPMRTRYVAVMFPALYLGVGIALSIAWRWVSAHRPSARPFAGAAICVALAVAVLMPVQRLKSYYDGKVEVGRTNERILAVAEYLERADEPIVLDGEITSSNTRSGNPSNVLTALCIWHALECTRHDDPAGLDDDLRQRSQSALVVVADEHFEALSARDRLTPVPGLAVPAINDVVGYGVYRLGGEGTAGP